MTKNFSIGLQGDDQPDWAYGQHKNYVWYFENVHGEQWVAKRDEDILRITGLDIDWNEIVLTLEEAKAEVSRLKEYLIIETLRTMPQYNTVTEQLIDSYKMTAVTATQSNIKYPLADWIFNNAEIYWLVSVLEASIPLMEWGREKNN